MERHFCKVGKTKLNWSGVLNLKDLEKKYKGFLEEAYNLIYTDAGLSDLLYHEASKLKKTIIYLKQNPSTGFDATF